MIERTDTDEWENRKRKKKTEVGKIPQTTDFELGKLKGRESPKPQPSEIKNLC